MDPNITGRTERFSQEEAFRSLAPEIERIVILDITEASHGNGSGCGMADIVSYRFVNKMDFASVYTNCITAKSFRMALTAPFTATVIKTPSKWPWPIPS